MIQLIETQWSRQSDRLPFVIYSSSASVYSAARNPANTCTRAPGSYSPSGRPDSTICGRPAVVIGVQIIEFDDFAVIRCHGKTARPFDVHDCLLVFPPPAQGPPTERVRHTALRGERIARRATLINVGSAHV